MTEKEPDIHNNHRRSGGARQWRFGEKHCHRPANQLSCPFKEIPRTKNQIPAKLFWRLVLGIWFLEFTPRSRPCPFGREKRKSNAVGSGAVPSATSKFASTRSAAEPAIKCLRDSRPATLHHVKYV